MSLRILMIGNDLQYLSIDALILRQKGLRVYLSDNSEVMKDMIDEIKPDLVFLNWQTHDDTSTQLYHSLLDNIRYASTPVVYTLSEDDVYLVNRKRTTAKQYRNIVCDNVLDAIKLALTNPAPPVRKRVRILNSGYQNISTAFRA